MGAIERTRRAARSLPVVDPGLSDTLVGGLGTADPAAGEGIDIHFDRQLPLAACLAGATLLVPLFTMGCSGGGGGGGNKGGGPGGNPGADSVTLMRDAWGVPHVFADTDRGALFGLGWAAAEDRLFQMLWGRVMIQGRVAEFFGPGLVPGRGETHVEHDRDARLQGWARHAADVVSRLDAETLALLQAYSDGVNAAVLDAGANINPLIGQHGLPLDPWQPEDCIGLWLRFSRHFTGDGSEEVTRLREWETLTATLPFTEAYNEMISGRVCDESAAVVQQSEVPAATQQALQAYAVQVGLTGAGDCPIPLDGPAFSQTWAVAGSRTITGRAVLVGDPRTEVYRPNTFYEWSVSGETFSVRGLGVAGSPNVLAGSTRDVAWSPTAIGLDQADLFSLTTDPVNQAGRYLYEGSWRPYEVDEVEILKVKGQPNRQLRYRETIWGPVTTAVLPDVLPGEEFAQKRVPRVEPDRETTAALFEVYRAGDLDQLFGALSGWSWPPVNLVFADSGGRVGYSVVGDVPVRAPGLVLPGVIPQDGSSVGTDWVDRLPWGLQPHVLDPSDGTVLSANHMPVGSWYPIPIRFGNGGVGDTMRSRRLRERLQALPALATPQEVFDVRTDTVNPARRDMVELGIWLRDSQPSHALSPDALSALVELEPWWNAGAPMDDSLPGSTVAWSMELLFREAQTGQALIDLYGGGPNGLNLFQKTVLAGIAAPTPVPLPPEEAAYVDSVLAGAWVRASALGPSTGWQAWFRNQVLTFQVDSWVSLEGLPSLKPAQGLSVGPVPCNDPDTLSGTQKQSHTQLVEIGAPDIASSLTPPGQSERPGPHELDQLTLWEATDVKLSPRTKAEVLASGPVTSVELEYSATAP